MKKFFLAFSILFLLQAAQAARVAPKPKVQRKPNQAAFEGFSTSIFFGDKTSVFKVWTDSSGSYFEYAPSEGARQQGKISGKNYKFLQEKVTEILAEPSNDPNLCTRSLVSLNSFLEGKRGEKVGCIGSKTPAAKKLTEFLNTLSLLL